MFRLPESFFETFRGVAFLVNIMSSQFKDNLYFYYEWNAPRISSVIAIYIHFINILKLKSGSMEKRAISTAK